MGMLFKIIFIGIGLSMDAFSLSILYGTLNLSKKQIMHLAVVVGIYHFIMPFIGNLLGNFFLSYITKVEYVVGFIFLCLSIQMLFSIKKQEEITILTNFLSFLLFGFTVSIDSFSIGLALGAMKYNILLSCLNFSILSALFTYFGLKIGKTFSRYYGNYATIFGSIILFVIALTYFF